jgi:hypothetical protein
MSVPDLEGVLPASPSLTSTPAKCPCNGCSTESEPVRSFGREEEGQPGRVKGSHTAIEEGRKVMAASSAAVEE